MKSEDIPKKIRKDQCGKCLHYFGEKWGCSWRKPKFKKDKCKWFYEEKR
jgi:hypothetical protein